MGTNDRLRSVNARGYHTDICGTDRCIIMKNEGVKTQTAAGELMPRPCSGRT